MRKISILLLLLLTVSCKNSRDRIANEVNNCSKKNLNSYYDLNLSEVYLKLENNMVKNRLIKDNSIIEYVKFLDSIIIPGKKLSSKFLKETYSLYKDYEIANINSPSNQLLYQVCFKKVLERSKHLEKKPNYQKYLNSIDLLLKSDGDNYYKRIKELIKLTPKEEFRRIEYRAPVLASIFNYLYLNLNFENTIKKHNANNNR